MTPHWTVAYLVRHTDGGPQVCLARKMNTLFRGHWFGYGGKVEAGETSAQATLRELREEAGIVARSMRHVGRLLFHHHTPPRVCDIYVVERWRGVPRHTCEMRKPRWFPINVLPPRSGPPEDRCWISQLVKNRTIRVDVYRHKRTIRYLPYYKII